MTAPDLTQSLETPADRLAAIRRRLEMAARRGGRAPDAVALIAVSKTHPPEAVTALIDAGQRHFGENRVQEALVKFTPLKTAHPSLVLHLIGPLQTNKTREAVGLFDVIHSLDRPSLADALAKERARIGHLPRLLLQVNTGEEAQKSGVAPQDVAAFLSDVCAPRGLQVDGLMCIPPAEEAAGPHFALLAKLAARHGLPYLSMGMSADFELAAALGATHVRVGSALFGARPAAKDRANPSSSE